MKATVTRVKPNPPPPPKKEQRVTITLNEDEATRLYNLCQFIDPHEKMEIEKTTGDLRCIEIEVVDTLEIAGFSPRDR